MIAEYLPTIVERYKKEDFKVILDWRIN